MFIRGNDNNELFFIKSESIKVFPCGRRRSLVDSDGSSNTVSDRYYIPFDPEARLNTEANNRKHSSLNGFKQNYLNYWNSDGIISLVLAGYLFTIDAKLLPDDFGKELVSEAAAAGDHIYANIKLANIKFFEGTEVIPECHTDILRDQTTHDDPLDCLDVLKTGG